jgi:hypothetical protein
MDKNVKASYRSSAIATDGGSLGLALKMSDGEIVHVTLDREIGSKTTNRILFMDKSIMSDAEELYWLPIFRQLLKETVFASNLERETVLEFITQIESRGSP